MTPTSDSLWPVVLRLSCRGQAFDWFRVVDVATGVILGSGFTSEEAAEMARRELRRIAR